jgi:hypothetical protein
MKVAIRSFITVVQEFCTKKEQLILRDFVVNASIPDEDE